MSAEDQAFWIMQGWLMVAALCGVIIGRAGMICTAIREANPSPGKDAK